MIVCLMMMSLMTVPTLAFYTVNLWLGSIGLYGSNGTRNCTSGSRTDEPTETKEKTHHSSYHSPPMMNRRPKQILYDKGMINK